MLDSLQLEETPDDRKAERSRYFASSIHRSLGSVLCGFLITNLRNEADANHFFEVYLRIRYSNLSKI
jgi:hypothetical protein